MDLLDVIGTVMKAVPALVEVVSTAFGGGQHPEEMPWVKQVVGLGELVEKLRSGDQKARDIVGDLLSEIPKDATHKFLESLK